MLTNRHVLDILDIENDALTQTNLSEIVPIDLE